MDKKGSWGDGIFFMAVLFVVAIVAVVTATLMNTLNDDFQNNSNIAAQGKSMFGDLNERFSSIVDNAFSMILVGLFLAVIVGAWFIRSHPAFFWLSVIIMAFILFLAAIYANFYKEFTGTADFATAAANLTVINFVMNNYLTFILVMILLLSIALYAKNSTNRFAG